jgi:hypothetical protein
MGKFGFFCITVITTGGGDGAILNKLVNMDSPPKERPTGLKNVSNTYFLIRLFLKIIFYNIHSKEQEQGLYKKSG